MSYFNCLLFMVLLAVFRGTFTLKKRKRKRVLGEILMFRAFIRDIVREAFKCVSACTKVTAQTN